MADQSLGTDLKEKSLELKKWFKDKNAEMEQWKFSIEDAKEGMRVELHAVALLRHTPKKK
jgi:hypothetical protein